MRTSFTALQTKCKQITQNASTDDATIIAFFKNEINLADRFIYAELNNYKTTKQTTRSTVDGTQYYQLPPDFMDMETITLAVGTVTYTLEALHSQEEWDKYNMVTFSGTAIPKYFFIRADDVGIWPIPRDVYTMTYNYSFRFKDLTAEDYTTGTISLTNASATVTGSGTTFTAAMVGRWITPTTDGYPYKLATFTNTTSMAMQDVFRGTTVAGDTFTIFESPYIPPELHELIPYRVAAVYFSGWRKDATQALFWNNMFWTGDGSMNSRSMDDAVGGLLGAKKRYSSRTSSGVVRRKKYADIYRDNIWSVTLSES